MTAPLLSFMIEKSQPCTKIKQRPIENHLSSEMIGAPVALPFQQVHSGH
jgi:hypothetical protein